MQTKLELRVIPHSSQNIDDHHRLIAEQISVKGLPVPPALLERHSREKNQTIGNLDINEANRTFADLALWSEAAEFVARFREKHGITTPMPTVGVSDEEGTPGVVSGRASAVLRRAHVSRGDSVLREAVVAVMAHELSHAVGDVSVALEVAPTARMPYENCAMVLPSLAAQPLE